MNEHLHAQTEGTASQPEEPQPHDEGAQAQAGKLSNLTPPSLVMLALTFWSELERVGAVTENPDVGKVIGY